MATVSEKIHDNIVISQEKCNGCGLCVKVCPLNTLSLKDGKAVITGKSSIGCGHCAAVCPQEAITVKSLNADLSFNSFDFIEKALPPGKFDTAKLVQLLSSRRSCRNFKDNLVAREKLDDLVKIASLAPSGTNSQRWSFVVLPDRNAVLKLGDHIASFFKRLNSLAEKRVLRQGLKAMGRKELDFYYREYYPVVSEGIQEWENQGIDRLFHGATAAILVGACRGATCPREDALLAAGNIILAAHSIGLGSCLIGYAVETIRRHKPCQRFLRLEKGEKIYACIALGYPDISFQRPSGRKKITPRYIDI